MTEEEGAWHGLAGEPVAGEMKGFSVGRQKIAIYNVDGELYATDNKCTHANAFLTEGFLEQDVVECPLHGGCFNVRTGEGLGAPIARNLRTYPIRRAGDGFEVFIPIEKAS